MHLEAQPKVTNAFVLVEPVFQLFGCMCGSIVQNEDHRLDLASQGFRNDHLLHKGLEIDKTLAASAGSIHLAIGDGESGKEGSWATRRACSARLHRARGT